MEMLIEEDPGTPRTFNSSKSNKSMRWSTSWHRAHQSTELQRIWSKNSLFVSMYLVMCTEHILVKLLGSMVWKFKLDEFGSDHVVYCVQIVF